MKNIHLSEKNIDRLLALKNSWSFSYRNVTNKVVLEEIEELKERVFGFSSGTSQGEIDSLVKNKSRKELEDESEKFQQGLDALITSGVDFEPEYTLDMLLEKIIELVEDGEVIGEPIF